MGWRGDYKEGQGIVRDGERDGGGRQYHSTVLEIVKTYSEDGDLPARRGEFTS